MSKKVIEGIAATALIGGAVAFTIWDYKNTVYECSSCGVVYKPTVSSYLTGMHTLKKRLLVCPNCHCRNWHIRALDD